MATFSNSLAEWQDTIAAIATPPGVGALGIIRLSGNSAIAIADKLMPRLLLHTKAANTIHVGWLVHHDERIDEVVVSIYRAPRSFTGEDVVELSCHGSSYILQKVMNALLQSGARLAKPGEYTQRAFLNGKLDLAQAEAVADVIASQSEAAHLAAIHQMRGGFSNELAALREQLIGFSALIELELDFATEDVEFADRTALVETVRYVGKKVNELLASFKLGNAIKQGVNVAIVGKPNAGKSTLLNRLLNEERAIVSDIAGTTRDSIEELLNIDGVIFRLIDTAGIRQSNDEIERIGVERSLEKLRMADIVVYLFDSNSTDAEELEEVASQLKKEARQYILVGNKADVASPANIESLKRFKPLFISAKSGQAVEVLKEALVAIVLDGHIPGEQTIVTNVRHYESLKALQKSLRAIIDGLNDALPGDLLSIEIRDSLNHLAEITGTITNEDQLDFIFSKFCIGK